MPIKIVAEALSIGEIFFIPIKIVAEAPNFRKFREERRCFSIEIYAPRLRARGGPIFRRLFHVKHFVSKSPAAKSRKAAPPSTGSPCFT